MPRVVNVALAGLLLAFLVPLFTHLGRVGTGAKVMLVTLALPFALLALLCLASAARPGCLGRLIRRTRG